MAGGRGDRGLCAPLPVKVALARARAAVTSSMKPAGATLAREITQMSAHAIVLFVQVRKYWGRNHYKYIFTFFLLFIHLI